MRNLKITLEYDGAHYSGWQVQTRQKSQKTIQEVLEKTLQKILQEKIRLFGSGRTDAGVHALAQVANFKTDSKILPEKLQYALNGLLPDDISVKKIEEVNLDFHSCLSAKSKVYRYTILNQPYPSALLRNATYFYRYPLDLSLMRQETHCLLGRHNFGAFCASGSSVKDTIRTIKRLSIKKSHQLGLIYIEIEADGFLYNMVRNIVGTLIEIGRGRFPKGSLKMILLSKNRKLAGPTAQAKGLCLLEVKY